MSEFTKKLLIYMPTCFINYLKCFSEMRTQLIFILPFLVLFDTVGQAKFKEKKTSDSIILTNLPNLSTVVNIANLRTRLGTSAGEMVQTLGYYLTNDGGGATYVWNTTAVTNDDGGSVIQVAGQSIGRWELVYQGIVYAKQFGVIGDGIHDDTIFLQNAVNFITNKAGKLILPEQITKITSTITVGTASPPSNPYTETSFTICGAGPTFNPATTENRYTNGSMIRLYGTGLNAIIDVKAGASRFAKFEDFTLSCHTIGGADYGFLWSQTAFSQHHLIRVHSYYANKAFAILNGGFANGEFTTFSKCVGYGVQNFFYMDSGSGQAFNQLFEHCAGSVADGGTLFEIGGGGLGFGFTAIEFESSNFIRFADSQGITFLKNHGISGIINFIGGRIEGVSTVIHNLLGSLNQNGKINFSGLHFDGMGSTSMRKFLKSTRANSNQSITFENCLFTPIDAAAEVCIHLGDTDNSSYVFRNCDFGAFSIWKVALSETTDGKVIFNDCQRTNLSTSGIVHFSKNYAFNSPNTVPSISKPQNLLLQSGFSSAAGSSIVAANPWIHTGKGSFYALYNHTNNLGGYSNDNKFRQIVLNANSGVYQDIIGFTFGSGVNIAYYRSLISYHSAVGMRIQVTLENSKTNKIYDQLIIQGSANTGAVFPIDLIANDRKSGGYLRVRILNLDEKNPFYLNMYNQYVCTNPIGSYVETTATTQDLPYITR